MASHLEVRFYCYLNCTKHLAHDCLHLSLEYFIFTKILITIVFISPRFSSASNSTDHPNVSYGPPITLSWDYLEYDPLDIDEYEIHHPKRRNLRQMGLNYYQRRNLLLLQTDYTEEELRLAWKSVKKAKQQRYITRTYTSAFPVRIVEDACQSAVRKVKRTMSGGGKRSSQ